MTISEWSLILAPARRNLLIVAGCTEVARQRAELALGVMLPKDLAGLLTHSDGLFDASAEHDVVWSLERLVAENLGAWAGGDLPLPPSLLGFGDDGAGDWFCVPAHGAGRAVYHWGWIDGAARPIAADLPSFLPRWLDGSLNV
jgi:hypothetical protein